MIEFLIVAVGLFLVLEGILPFVSPKRYRAFLDAIRQQSNRGLRIMGAVSMILGLVIIVAMRYWFNI